METYYLKVYTTLLVILEVFVMSGQNILRVATFNIRYDGHKSPPVSENENIVIPSAFDGEQPWYVRRKKVAEAILFHRVDIIGLQEVLYNQVKDLEVLLGENWQWTGVGRDDGKNKGEFVPIFYKKRFKLLESKNLWLSNTPDVPSKGWDASLPRIVTQASFRDTLTNTTFWFFNTHFDDRGHIARKESAKLLIKEYHELSKVYSDAVILTGDFNCKEEDDPYQILTGKKYSKLTPEELELESAPFGDTRYEISRPKTNSFGNSDTFTGFSPDVEPIRIDFIFVSNKTLGSVEISNHGVMSNRYDDGMYISDHRPVIADLIFKTNVS